MFFASDGPGDLIFLTWTPDNNQASLDSQMQAAFEQMAAYLLSRHALLLNERIYGDSQSASIALQKREHVYKQAGFPTNIPPTCVDGRPFCGQGIAGIHAFALQNQEVQSPSLLTWQGQACGRVACGKEAQYLALSDAGRFIRQAGQQKPVEETKKTFDIAESLLAESHWSFHDVRRTWFYLHNILDWYEDFNQIRNSAFKRMGLLNGNPLSSIPASTGIQGRNADGGWCTLDLLAMKPLDNHFFKAERLVNPLQNEAPDYGSAFARALSVWTDRSHYIFVSGTASINDQGISVYEGDFEQQTRRTLENVQRLLETVGASLSDICQATSFVKRPQDVEAYYKIAHETGLETIPAVCTLADVCREELLYELDATAVLPS